MRLIKQMVHEHLEHLFGNAFERIAARGIILNKNKILLLYTKRYNDYSFPGGGVEPNEDVITGLKREIAEETGATNIEILSEFGYIDEYRPHYKPEYDLIHMLSYFYVCQIDDHLSTATLEDYELANGMSAVWIDIHEAIGHNQEVIAKQESSMGFSIKRETLVLELVAEELIKKHFG
ncbi:NUDIX domain-containing protein [Paenibacillus alginolyticus]|uniref:NUDIX domain-containing protein n=1 Tax=Paenibacillus alginolyticus TaxID=59839 RepID=A0ABT4G7U8_9BACL|nr:NUDIX hydrolase [Paenibacillus alginolyticus]MCY9692241.1 NUDIX domain-containing protein [Paenibacillus alginolyticus]MEC0145917.1 NUDIX hydrolase [Paenibacillus alginolyticus]